eukprot:6056707-Pyramimonas_sp.AAC.1
MYGAAMSLVGTMLFTRIAMAHYNIHSVEDMRAVIGAASQPLAQGMKGAFSPITTSLQVCAPSKARPRYCVNSLNFPAPSLINKLILVNKLPRRESKGEQQRP